MAATYPGGIVAFPTRSDGTIIAASHVNGVQDEIMALETELLTRGNWTALLIGSAGGAAVQATSTGFYYKAGKTVTIDCLIVLTGVGTLVGNCIISGLPFTIHNGIRPNFVMDWSGLTTAVSMLMGSGLINTTTIEVRKVAAAGGTTTANLVLADLSATTVLRLSGSYSIP